ncbi:MAG: nitroreductase [Thermodesulfovibrio sp.]|nr:nitroreductase [Thermodesulfovibrio sp.]
MLIFTVDKQKCTGCGECAEDCPAHIIEMENGLPGIAADKEASCYRCQHCFAVCPTGAVSILGLKPEESLVLPGNKPAPEELEILIRGRRSVRRYLPENLDEALLQRLLEVAWYAPTAVNARQVQFTVVNDRKKMAALREDVIAGLSRMVREGTLPEGLGFFAGIVTAWEENKIDVIFRWAPHLIIASAPQNSLAPVVDSLIALSYFELFAQGLGVGAVWAGLAKWAINDLLPETRKRLGVPDDHVIGYALLFGKPAVRYARTVQRGKANIHFAS